MTADTSVTVSPASLAPPDRQTSSNEVGATRASPIQLDLLGPDVDEAGGSESDGGSEVSIEEILISSKKGDKSPSLLAALLVDTFRGGKCVESRSNPGALWRCKS